MGKECSTPQSKALVAACSPTNNNWNARGRPRMTNKTDCRIRIPGRRHQASQLPFSQLAANTPSSSSTRSSMVKNEGFRADAPSATSDYPDLISDTAVILAKERIVPDVVDNCLDKAAFKVTFGDRLVLPGDTLSINNVASEPKIEITQCSPTGVYSLLILDPDMPSPTKPEYKDVLIMMLNNIKKDDVESADFTVEYSSTLAEPGKGTHRYAVLLFEQPGFQSHIHAPAKRAHFQTKQFARDHQWGDPVAGVYFKVKHGE